MSGSLWTDAEIKKLRQLSKRLATVDEMQRVIGRNDNAIRKKLRSMGLPYGTADQIVIPDDVAALAGTIKAYWAARGYRVRVWAERTELGRHKNRNHESNILWAIKSDMLNAWPRYNWDGSHVDR